MPILDPNQVISGNYGYVYDENGEWLSTMYKVEATVELGFEEVKRAGTRWTGYKLTSLKGSGTVSGYMATSSFIERIGVVADDKSSPYTTQLVVKVEDPESDGTYRVLLKEVKFDKIPVIAFEVGSLVEQELSFSFSGYEVLDSLE